MHFSQDFRRDFDQFDFRGAPFAFARFGDGERAIVPANSINDAIQMLWKDGHSVGESFKEFEARMLEAVHTEYGMDGVIYDDPFSKRKETHERGGRKDGAGGRPDGGAEEGVR